MTIGAIRTRDVVVVRRDTKVSEAAVLMRKHHVGDVVVVDEVHGQAVPCGLLTDRDIVIELVAEGLDADTIKVGEMMSSELILGHAGDAVADAIAVMRVNGVRRLPLVNAAGGLIGIVTADDLLYLLADEMKSLAMSIERERCREVVIRGPLGGAASAALSFGGRSGETEI